MRYCLYLGGLLILLTLWRAWFVWGYDWPLYVDEAQYWYWAQSLAWGYYSKPPVIALLIAATTTVCGDSEACVRSASLVLYPLTTSLIFLIAQRLFNARTALVSALIFVTMPAVGLSSTLISTDVALFFCWALALYAFVRALDSHQWRDWLLLGLALGLGLLSKYTMGVFFVSALLYVLWSGRWSYVWSIQAWSAVLLAFVLFLPNLWWNYQHGFPTFQHTAEISQLEHAGLRWGALAAFLAGQLGMFGLLFFPLLALWLHPKTWQPAQQTRLLISFTLPFLVIISLQALLGGANANWAAPAYVAASIGLAACLVQLAQWRLLVVGLSLNVLLVAVLYHYEPITRTLGIELHASNDPYKRLRGWRQLGQQYLDLQTQYPNALPMAAERGILSELAYYARPQGLQIVSWNPQQQILHHYDLVTSLQGRVGQDFLYVTAGHLPEAIKPYFKQTEIVGRLHVPIYQSFSLDHQVYHLTDFQGLASP